MLILFQHFVNHSEISVHTVLQPSVRCMQFSCRVVIFCKKPDFDPNHVRKQPHLKALRWDLTVPMCGF